MENPFLSNNNQNPFQTPYHAPAGGAPGSEASGAGPQGTRAASPVASPLAAASFANAGFANDMSASSNPFLNSSSGASSSPFLDGSLSKAFSGRDSTISPNPQTQSLSNPAASTFAPKPNSLISPIASPIDFSPAPSVSFSTPVAAMPIAARQSQIMAVADLHHKPKPEFFQTSTATFDGFSIQEYLGMISVEVVIPKDLLFRNPAPHGELHRMKDAEDQLQRVKVAALNDLGAKAKALSADGIVGVSLQFSQFDAVVCLCSAVGTAVKISN